jgi:beta-galactosidase
MLVIDEAFDHWEKPKNPQDYHRYFKEWHQTDLQAMIRRDRNHPSVIMWSIGNEVNERADTSGVRIGRKLAALVKELDSTRPVNAAICGFWDHPGLTWEDSEPAFSYLDVGGYNYQWKEYEADHQKFPERIMLGSESFPMEAWENWEMVKKHAYVIGDFVWTGMDYLGETGIGHTIQDNEEPRFAMTWPWYIAWCGDLDLAGNKKPQSYYRVVVWGNSDLEMAVHTPLPAGRSEIISKWGWPDEQQSWTWPGSENKTMDVNVYTSGDQVKLVLNDKTIGEKSLAPKDKLTAKFKVPYKPGELKVVALREGIQLGEKILRTAGEPAAIELVPDRVNLMPDPNDLSYISVEIRDSQGLLVPHANIPLQFEIQGPGEIIAAGNASPEDMASFRGETVKTFRGRALVIVRPVNGPGKILLKANGKNLPERKTELVVLNISSAL